MNIKLLTEHHLESQSLEGGYTGSSESTLVKIPHCWKSHVATRIVMLQLTSTWYQCTLAERWVRRQMPMSISKSLVREATGANAIFRSQTVPGSLEQDR